MAHSPRIRNICWQCSEASTSSAPVCVRGEDLVLHRDEHPTHYVFTLPVSGDGNTDESDCETWTSGN